MVEIACIKALYSCEFYLNIQFLPQQRNCCFIIMTTRLILLNIININFENDAINVNPLCRKMQRFQCSCSQQIAVNIMLKELFNLCSEFLKQFATVEPLCSAW